jgi:hypothetical protein
MSLQCRPAGISKIPGYSRWNAMHQRCTNPNSLAYNDYGGRSITVWRAMLESMLACCAIASLALPLSPGNEKAAEFPRRLSLLRAL